MRLFIAINIDPSLRPALAALQEELKASGAPVSWVKPANLHFTLKFLGEVPEATLPVLRQALRASVAGTDPFTVSLGDLGTFPPRGRPRIVWVGVQEGFAEMKRIRERLDAALAPLGFPPEKRAFQPHLTLGRVRDVGRSARLVEVLRTVEGGPVGRTQVVSVDLMQSQLHPAGAVYTVITMVPLGGEA